MKVSLAYGQGHLPVELPDGRTTVIEPSHTPGLADERGAVLAALGKAHRRPPVAGVAEARQPRLHRVHRHHPRHAQRPPDSLAAELPGRCAARAHHPAQRTSARIAPTPAPNWSRLLTPAVVQNYRVLNHEAGESRRADRARHDARRHPGPAQPPLRRGGRADRHGLHRAAFLRRFQRRPERHHAGRRRPADGDEQPRRQQHRRSQCHVRRHRRQPASGRRCATSPCAPARASC